MSDKKIWVHRVVNTGYIEDNLNELALDGYQIFKIEFKESNTPRENDLWHVFAFDPIFLAEQMQRVQMKSIQASNELLQELQSKIMGKQEK